jgi:protein-S-isoprenylcysteine O-methyltransferase Ste14
MQRILALGYALFAYLCFFATFLWLVAFVADFRLAPTTVNYAINGASTGQAIFTDLLLIALFGMQHSLMARPAFKSSWTKLVPTSVERSTYVLAASVMLAILMGYWHPISGALWDFRGSPAEPGIWVLFFAGWTMLFISTWLINHFELFGLQQAWLHGREKSPPPALREPLFYRYIRHPIYAGFTLAFWATPHMTYSHLLFAAGMTTYILIGIAHEERDLVNHFGRAYEEYRGRVGMLIPGIGRRAPPSA